VQAQNWKPSTLIYIVFMSLIKIQAAARKAGFGGLKWVASCCFSRARQFRTKNVDKIVSKRLDSMQVH
jgi:hypothetical protein